jgi:ABC-2 type transport system permease protein
MFANYPVDVFAGVAKVLLYTVVPAAFVTAVPARLIDDFDPVVAGLLFAVALAFAFTGWATFTLGLRRYASGAIWTRA